MSPCEKKQAGGERKPGYQALEPPSPAPPRPLPPVTFVRRNDTAERPRFKHPCRDCETKNLCTHRFAFRRSPFDQLGTTKQRRGMSTGASQTRFRHKGLPGLCRAPVISRQIDIQAAIDSLRTPFGSVHDFGKPLGYSHEKHYPGCRVSPPPPLLPFLLAVAASNLYRLTPEQPRTAVRPDCPRAPPTGSSRRTRRRGTASPFVERPP